MSTRVRLVDGISNAKFVALSHRWGPKTKKVSLTKANFTEFREEVPQSSLYQLFRDAITLTGKIGLRYIWIDCLCIMQGDSQDDINDWSTQAGNMTAIYAGAFLTISGTGCVDADEGLFQNSPVAADTMMVAKIKPYSIYFRPMIRHPRYFSRGSRPEFEQSVYPLTGRGWVYQERALSKRIVHFTQEEVIWECMKNFQCQCGHNTRPGIIKDFLQTSWKDIIATYSHMDLTTQTDRLPAIAGVAKAYAERHSLKYLAGL
ncbi:hypothetical protein M426DRAFT_69937, partial [Hypoxylon sp. CI-4A]